MKTKTNGYKTFLLYKKVLQRFREGDCGRKEIAKATDLEVNDTLHLINVLKKEGVIKISSFEVSDKGSKRMIYRLMKDE